MSAAATYERTERVFASVEDFQAEATRRFGPDAKAWRFICPCCAHVAAVVDWIDAGAPASAAGFSCIGRWLSATPRDAFADGAGPCNYAGGGFFRLNPWKIEGMEERYFALAPEPAPIETSAS